MNDVSTIVDATVATCPVQCPEDHRQCARDMRPVECRAADLDDEIKAALCRSEPLPQHSIVMYRLASSSQRS